MKFFLRAALLATLLGAVPATAATLSDAEQINLQVAMQAYIDSHAVNDALLQVDPATAEVNAYVAAKAHPKIMAWGDNMILCSDFVDQNGKTVMGNFYMTKREGAFFVFQATFGDDPALMKLMKDGKAVMAN